MFKTIQTSKKTGSQGDVMTFKSINRALAHLVHMHTISFWLKYMDIAVPLRPFSLNSSKKYRNGWSAQFNTLPDGYYETHVRNAHGLITDRVWCRSYQDAMDCYEHFLVTARDASGWNGSEYVPLKNHPDFYDQFSTAPAAATNSV